MSQVLGRWPSPFSDSDNCALVTGSVRPAGISVWRRAPVAEAEVRAAAAVPVAPLAVGAAVASGAAVPDELLAAGAAVASGAVAAVPVAPWE
jgi:hypothetical protein